SMCITVCGNTMVPRNGKKLMFLLAWMSDIWFSFKDASSQTLTPARCEHITNTAVQCNRKKEEAGA
ncbi:MAG TPA: hypothetical protein PK321_12165, partial [Clostridia bacterium]|nr:hypothetical protein [Clostridia bacterium]